MAVASRFIGSSPIVWQENNRGQRYGYERTSNEPLLNWPMVVLIDRNSASASEVLALVLRDAGRAQLVGSPTYGKGTIQYLFELSDGSGLHLTSARWVSPAGSRLEPSGLTPDVPVGPLANEGDDPASKQALSLLRPITPGAASGPLSPALLPPDECTPRSANAA